MRYLLATICASLVAISFGAKLPTGFKKCNLKQISSHQCLPNAIESAIKQMNRPSKKLGLVSMEPLVIPLMIMDAGNQFVTAQHTYKNMRVSGFNETTCSKAEFNYTEKTLNLECVVPHFRMDFNYEGRGQIMMISAYGNGTGWFLLSDNQLGLTFKFGEYEKKGKTYFNIIHQELRMQPKDFDFDLQNMFDGDEQSADRLKQVLKENARELYEDVRPGYEEAFGKVFASIFEKILGRVPIVDIFG
ncbi:protein takeout-like [Zophobas morio]|uniref:protein takeout-like n=1 Tax=Zophobas morio TaxID=2755281 RepID=UPI0030827961